MGRQEVAAEIRRKKLVSQKLELVGTHRGALKDLHSAAKTLFTYLKHLSYLEKERESGRPVPFNPVLFAAFFSSLESAQHAWRLGRQRFSSGCFLFII